MNDEDLYKKIASEMSRFKASPSSDFSDRVMAGIEEKGSLGKAWKSWLDDLRAVQWEAMAAACVFAVVAGYAVLPHPKAQAVSSIARQVNITDENDVGSGEVDLAMLESDEDLMEGLSNE